MPIEVTKSDIIDIRIKDYRNGCIYTSCTINIIIMLIYKGVFMENFYVVYTSDVFVNSFVLEVIITQHFLF